MVCSNGTELLNTKYDKVAAIRAKAMKTDGHSLFLRATHAIEGTTLGNTAPLLGNSVRDSSVTPGLPTTEQETVSPEDRNYLRPSSQGGHTIKTEQQ